MHTATLVIMVEVLYYGFVSMGLVVLMVMIAAAWRQPDESSFRPLLP